MYTNMLSQLKQVKLENLLPRTLELIPEVRLDAGLPPLVTPTSQIIGSQAVNCALDETKGQPMYTTRSIQFVNLVKGIYGKTLIPSTLNSDIRLPVLEKKHLMIFDSIKNNPTPFSKNMEGLNWPILKKKNYCSNFSQTWLTTFWKIEQSKFIWQKFIKLKKKNAEN